MLIHVNRNGQAFGPYTEEQARAMLANGQLLAGDLALAEGGQQWEPLGQLLGGEGGMETYNRVSETVGGLSLRKNDNIIQAIVVVAGTALSTGVGFALEGANGAFVGVLGGLVVFGLGSGVVLMVLRWFKKGS